MNERWNFKTYLPHGAIKDIADRLDFSRVYVSRVANGGAFNEKIMKELFKVSSRRKRLIEKFQSL
jgi:hypothetical protein